MNTKEQEQLAKELYRAVHNGDADTCLELLNEGASPNVAYVGEKLPLAVAVKDERVDIATMLLEHHADPNSGDVLHEAVRNCDLDTAAVLLKFGSDPNAIDQRRGMTPLATALSMPNDGKDRLDMIELLFDFGADHRQALWEAQNSDFSDGAFPDFLNDLVREREANELKAHIKRELSEQLTPKEAQGVVEEEPVKQQQETPQKAQRRM